MLIMKLKTFIIWSPSKSQIEMLSIANQSPQEVLISVFSCMTQIIEIRKEITGSPCRET